MIIARIKTISEYKFFHPSYAHSILLILYRWTCAFMKKKKKKNFLCFLAFEYMPSLLYHNGNNMMFAFFKFRFKKNIFTKWNDLWLHRYSRRWEGWEREAFIISHAEFSSKKLEWGQTTNVFAECCFKGTREEKKNQQTTRKKQSTVKGKKIEW